MAADLWSSVPWQLEAITNSRGSVSTWHKHHVPYESNSNALQNLDVWVPVTELVEPQARPSPTFVPTTASGIWLIYIHGGAWRDPLIDSSSFKPTMTELLLNHPDIMTQHCVAGLAAINYSLSIHPHHPTHPSPPKEPGQPIDPSRQAKHPDHILDVLSGLSFLQTTIGFGNNYVLIGHSCGATLSFEVAMDHAKWGSEASVLAVTKPKAIIGLNGLYNMLTAVHDLRKKHQHLAPMYESFTHNAFGDDKNVWHLISPTSVSDWASEWPEGSRAVLVCSQEDSLVPSTQTQDMLDNLRRSKGPGLEVFEPGAVGDHNEIWQKGDRVAEVIKELIKSL